MLGMMAVNRAVGYCASEAGQRATSAKSRERKHKRRCAHVVPRRPRAVQVRREVELLAKGNVPRDFLAARVVLKALELHSEHVGRLLDAGAAHGASELPVERTPVAVLAVQDLVRHVVLQRLLQGLAPAAITNVLLCKRGRGFVLAR